MAPIDWQEIWAAGVTYLRSRDARMEESQEKSVYDRVYDADRPELFLKANVFRTSGPGQPVGIRGDSTWDVPEPECVLVINSAGEIVGYTIGNDVSSRSIEGENPLYLPQAKMFDKGAGLGPVIALAWEIDDPQNLDISLVIRRGGKVAFEGEDQHQPDAPHLRGPRRLPLPVPNLLPRRFPDDRHRHRPAKRIHPRRRRPRLDHDRRNRHAGKPGGEAVNPGRHDTGCVVSNHRLSITGSL